MDLVVDLQVAYTTIGVSVVHIVINGRKRVGGSHRIRHACTDPVPVTVGDDRFVNVAVSIREIDRLGRVE